MISFKDIKAGDKLKADDGFNCLIKGKEYTVYADDGLQENMHVLCSHGKHFLNANISSDGFLIGFEKVQNA